MNFVFIKLNDDWNAEPNAPHLSVELQERDLILKFSPNTFISHFSVVTSIIFKNCSKYRLGATNDEGWYRGQCRFSKLLPAWGEFYEISGPKELLDAPQDWKTLHSSEPSQKHFLFYFRDETFECVADSFEISHVTEK